MRVPIILMTAALASPASAQSRSDLTRLTDSWAKENKVFVTASARKQLSEKLMVMGAYPTGPAKKAYKAEKKAEKAYYAAFGFLRKFPAVRVTVRPVPPIDYTVAINGQDCPPDVGVYKVHVGAVEVRVVRTGKPPCTWKGTLSEGQTQAVACNL
jgi:hypothetical protein